jgi:hypothetical protein
MNGRCCPPGGGGKYSNFILLRVDLSPLHVHLLQIPAYLRHRLAGRVPTAISAKMGIEE